MASLDTVSLGILFGALLVLAGILSSLVALRFGAPLLLVFLIFGMLAGEEGPGGLRFDDVRTAYIVGSIALALILFDGGLRTRFSTFRSVLMPSLTLATVGVLMTAAHPRRSPTSRSASAGPIAAGRLGGCLDRRGRGVLSHPRTRPAAAPARQRDAEDRSGTNDPFAIFLTIMLVEMLLQGHQSWSTIALSLVGKGSVAR